jgi:hypothetical protein
MKRFGFGLYSRQGAKSTKFGTIFPFLCGLCVIAGDNSDSFGCGPAALRLSGVVFLKT